MTSFTVQDNFIVTKNALIAIYEIEPIDVILLPEQEQKAFEADLHRTLNSLGSDGIQLIMRTRKAVPEDLRRHFKNLSTQSFTYQNKRMETAISDLVQNYISSLSNLLEENIIPIKEYYIVFKEKTNPQNPTAIKESIKELDRTIERVTGNLARASVRCEQVVNYHPVEGSTDNVIESDKLDQLLSSFIRL
jgi:hypothetical protein